MIDSLTRLLLEKYKPKSELLQAQPVTKATSELTTEELLLISRGMYNARIKEELEQASKTTESEEASKLIEEIMELAMAAYAEREAVVKAQQKPSAKTVYQSMKEVK